MPKQLFSNLETIVSGPKTPISRHGSRFCNNCFESRNACFKSRRGHFRSRNGQVRSRVSIIGTYNCWVKTSGSEPETVHVLDLNFLSSWDTVPKQVADVQGLTANPKWCRQELLAFRWFSKISKVANIYQRVCLQFSKLQKDYNKNRNKYNWLDINVDCAQDEVPRLWEPFCVDIVAFIDSQLIAPELAKCNHFLLFLVLSWSCNINVKSRNNNFQSWHETVLKQPFPYFPTLCVGVITF